MVQAHQEPNAEAVTASTVNLERLATSTAVSTSQLAATSDACSTIRSGGFLSALSRFRVPVRERSSRSRICSRRLGPADSQPEKSARKVSAVDGDAILARAS